MPLGPAVLDRSLVERFTQGPGGCLPIPTPRRLLPLQGLHPPPFQKQTAVLRVQPVSIRGIDQQQRRAGGHPRSRFRQERAKHPSPRRTQLKQAALRHQPALERFAPGIGQERQGEHEGEQPCKKGQQQGPAKPGGGGPKQTRG
jgi:hypothetical protein